LGRTPDPTYSGGERRGRKWKGVGQGRRGKGRKGHEELTPPRANPVYAPDQQRGNKK